MGGAECRTARAALSLAISVCTFEWPGGPFVMFGWRGRPQQARTGAAYDRRRGASDVREIPGYALIAGLLAFALLMVAGVADGQYDDAGSAIAWLSSLVGRG